MLRVALRHRYGAQGFCIDAAFATPDRGVTALFGPSGCGKSTILAAVAGLLRPQHGQIVLDGTVLLDTAQRVFVVPERRSCGLVFQEARLFPHLSVATNLRYGLRRAPPGATGPSFDEVVALLGIEPLLARRPGRLSGGERQRVALGRALLARPRLLLLDEPLAALDAARRTEVLPFLARLRDAARLPILYVTHALDEVDALADRMVLLQDGRVLAEGPVEALATRTDLPLLAGRRDAGVVLTCTVLGHDAARGVSRLGFRGGELVVPLRAEPIGTGFRIRLRARDIAVATRRPEAVSINNILPCRLDSISAGPSPHEVFLHLAIGETTLLSRTLADVVVRLGLTRGMPLFALIKAIAFDHAGPIATPPEAPIAQQDPAA
jgi:molybdate transport system ATP-binding protein